MTKHELLGHKGDAIYLPMRIPRQIEKKLFRMTESSLDVFSYEKFPQCYVMDNDITNDVIGLRHF
eukprot:GAHX01003154.1.p1 GENE.GAHX01003154.1~~GAHX01003154.1.p1  ORF type:complete len:75 (+),score=5.34 GAHX01003154.1:32-226(+)